MTGASPERPCSSGLNNHTGDQRRVKPTSLVSKGLTPVHTVVLDQTVLICSTQDEGKETRYRDAAPAGQVITRRQGDVEESASQGRTRKPTMPMR